jgi:site-specific recombinase XerD
MAYLKKNKNKVGKIYYSSRVKNAHWSKGYIYIPLRTSDYEVALERHEEVEGKEKSIKRGIEYDWSWLDADSRGRTKIKKLTLDQLVNEFINTHKTNVRNATIKRYMCAYNGLMNVVGKTCPPKSLNNQSVELFKKDCKRNGRKNNGINIELRAIKTLLLWAKDEGYIDKMPKIKMMSTEVHIKYINDSDWDKIMQSDIDDFYKETFTLLRDIGVRRSDLMYGRLDGSFFVIDAQYEKTNTNKEILLNNEQIELVLKFQSKKEVWLNKGLKINSLLDKLTKAFSNICKEVGIYEEGKTNLHCLRHTFAVREYLKCRDIFKVCQLLHHTSVTTTEKYARLNINRLEQDFPSLIKVSKVSKIRHLGTQKGATLTPINTSSRLYN